MAFAPEAVQSDHDVQRKSPESAPVKESAGPEASSALGGYLSALGTDGRNGSNPNLLSNPVMRHPASGEIRMLALRRAQQGIGNHKTQQLVAQLRRSSLVQRQCSCGGTCESCQGKSVEEEPESKVVQRQSASASNGDEIADANVIPTDSPGHPLDHGTRAFMEPRFGTDFSDVRVHTDSRAAESADALAANAYTTGRDIYFAAGKYAPASLDGQHLLAHELTHTVQQGNGSMPMAASRAGGVLVGDANDPMEAEAERSADAVSGSRAEAVAEISKSARSSVRRDIKSGAAAVWDATGGRLGRAAGALWDEAKET